MGPRPPIAPPYRTQLGHSARTGIVEWQSLPPIAAVEVARDDTVLAVTLNRPEVRNAVDGPTAAALSQAFRDFDADPDLRVAVLTGAGGVFCAGADLATIASGVDGSRSLRVTEDGDGPLGVTRMSLGKP
jgi:enoyl-CoA hydratase